MAEFSLGDVLYRSKLLCAFDQWHLLNRMRPIMPALSGLDLDLRWVGASIKDVAAALAPLSQASDEDMLFVFRASTGACEQKHGEAWGPIKPMPGMADLMRLVTLVFAENFGPLFALDRVSFRPIRRDSPQYEPVAMPNGEDWLFRPVVRNICKIESLYDGTLRIEHIAKANDALDVSDENEARAHHAIDKRR